MLRARVSVRHTHKIHVVGRGCDAGTFRTIPYSGGPYICLTLCAEKWIPRMAERSLLGPFGYLPRAQLNGCYSRSASVAFALLSTTADFSY